MLRHLFAVATVLVAIAATPAADEPKVGDDAPDFPLGQFSDGGRYRLSDFRGQVVVLFFYEKDCPRCKGKIPDRNDVAKAFAGKPVKFFAVGAGDSVGEVGGYIHETGLAMTTFADNLGLMERRYGFHLSLQNIWQFRVIGPDGKIAAKTMDKATIDRVLAKVEGKSESTPDVPAKLKPAAEAFAGGQYATAAKLLATAKRDASLTAAATAMQTRWKEQAQAWRTEAAGAEPIPAYDLHSRVVALLPGDDLAKQSAEAIKPLASQKPVLAELAARKAMADLEAKLARLTPATRAAALPLTKEFLKRHANTPSGERVQALATEIGG